MNQQTIQQFLESASKAYYSGNPIIPDSVYDALEEQYKIYSVGYKGEDVPHTFRLYSLEKFYAGEKEPTRWFDSPVETVKLDGANISATYINGKLTRVLTRGDGIKGKDITNKFLGSKELIPVDIWPIFGVMQVTFEVVASKDIPNSRNYCAGALNLKDVNEFYERKCDFIAHSIQGETNELLFHTYRKAMQWLHDHGFNTILDKPTWDDYPSDGKVIREDSFALFEEFGYTDHHPRGAYAIKERKEGVVTTLLDVIWQVGRTGKVSPVALLDPIDIDGATVSRATLHNTAFIEALELSLGDKVEVERAGSIIPAIIRKVN